MSTFDYGASLDPWPDTPGVTVIPHMAFFAVHCAHCGLTEVAYMPTLVKHPGWVADTVARHAACPERAA